MLIVAGNSSRRYPLSKNNKQLSPLATSRKAARAATTNNLCHLFWAMQDGNCLQSLSPLELESAATACADTPCKPLSPLAYNTLHIQAPYEVYVWICVGGKYDFCPVLDAIADSWLGMQGNAALTNKHGSV
jgi:hypothetical protein